MGVEEQGVCPQRVVTVLLGSVSWSSIPRGPGLEREGSPSIEGKEGRGEGAEEISSTVGAWDHQKDRYCCYVWKSLLDGI